MDSIPAEDYTRLLANKKARIESLYQVLSPPPLEVFASQPQGYRMRAEFRLWHDGDDLYYAMFQGEDRKIPQRIDSFPVACSRIQTAMPILRTALLNNPQLRRKLFQVEFLATLSGELLVSLIYHRALDEDWVAAASPLEELLGASLVGRSRKQKMVISRDFVEEMLALEDRTYHYRQYEQAFTQPNAGVNCEMIKWACDNARGNGADLLELYCGNGNFTLPMASLFESVIATEVSKASIRAAQHNCAINQVDNIEFIRLSAEEVSEALAGGREFRRLQGLPRALVDYRFSTIFVDPPRAGLDPATTKLVSQFDNVIYISCNPATQIENLKALAATHDVKALALFDQFPYTDHIECGAALSKR